jgi:cytochrome c biogenesis protein CcdA
LALDLSVILILLTGLALGLAHSFDPDHIVAISTLLCNTRSLRKSITSATVWGVGHSAVLFLVGVLVLILRVEIPQNVVNLFEIAAGVMLVVLGGFVLKPFIMERTKTSQPLVQTEKHPLQNQNLTHSHDGHTHTHVHKSAFAGVLQGLGGSAALMLVTLTTVSSVVTGLAFILVFGVGVILGMIGISCVVGSIIVYTATKLEKVHRIIQAVTGSASIIVGIIIIVYAVV